MKRLSGFRPVALVAAMLLVTLSASFGTLGAATAQGNPHGDPPGQLKKQGGGSASGSFTNIDHVVVLMQENRSYDSYFAPLHFQGQPQSSVESQKPNPNP